MIVTFFVPGRELGDFHTFFSLSELVLVVTLRRGNRTIRLLQTAPQKLLMVVPPGVVSCPDPRRHWPRGGGGTNPGVRCQRGSLCPLK